MSAGQDRQPAPKHHTVILSGGQARSPGSGNDPSANQRAAAAGRADQRDGKADKNSDRGGGRSGGRGKDKPGNTRNKGNGR